MLFRFLFLMCSALFVSGFADTYPKEKLSLEQPTSSQETQIHEGVGLGLQADALYLWYSTPKMLFAAEVDSTNNTTQGEVFSAQGKGRFGVDLKLSYVIPTEHKLAISASWFNIMAKFDRSLSSRTLSPVFISGLYSSTPANASNQTRLNLNIFDVLLLKTFKIGKYFSSTPYGGFTMEFTRGKGTSWFTATSGEFRSGVTNAQFSQKVDYNGYGVKLGSQGAIHLGCGFAFQGDIAGSFFYGNTDAYMKLYENLDRTTVIAQGKYDQNYGVFLIDALLGFSWEKRFCHTNSLVNIHAGYRVQSFYPGWMEMSVEVSTPFDWVALYGQGIEAGITVLF